MSWSNQPPTEPGIYWHRHGPTDDSPLLVQVVNDQLGCSLLARYIDEPRFAPITYRYATGGEWHGPLRAPP
jgi:hypothetical protein